MQTLFNTLVSPFKSVHQKINQLFSSQKKEKISLSPDKINSAKKTLFKDDNQELNQQTNEMYFKIYVKRVQNDISDLLDYDKLHIVNLNNDQISVLPQKRNYSKKVEKTQKAQKKQSRTSNRKTNKMNYKKINKTEKNKVSKGEKIVKKSKQQ